MSKLADDFSDRIRQEKEALEREELEVLYEKKAALHKVRTRFYVIFMAIIASILMTLTAILLIKNTGLTTPSIFDDEKSMLIPSAIATTAIAMLAFVMVLNILRAKQNTDLIEIDKKLASVDSEKLKDSLDENFFTKLVQINFKYIDIYYLQTQEQAKKSFTMAAIASGIGFIVIILGITLMYQSNTTPAYVTTGAGILTEFISAVFFYFYNRTILKMSEYHQKLVLTQNIGIALKITDEMTEESKNKTLEVLVDRLTLDINKHLSSDGK